MIAESRGVAILDLGSIYLLAANGEGGIRTHGDPKATPVFKTGAFNRSATSPGPASTGIRMVADASRWITRRCGRGHVGRRDRIEDPYELGHHSAGSRSGGPGSDRTPVGMRSSASMDPRKRVAVDDGRPRHHDYADAGPEFVAPEGF